MPDAPYTPTTGAIQDFIWEHEPSAVPGFDRWLSAHDAEIADKERDTVVKWLDADATAWTYPIAAALTRAARAIAANEHLPKDEK